MEKMSSMEIKNKFLSFFQENDHLKISDSSIVPKNDPTLLFINSGMAPLKNYFTGAEKPPYARLCNVQPCIRTIDIDSIGDKHHLTSFQMLGSWSVNDYFKEKAIFLAYKLLTEYIKIPKEKLYVTVFSGDAEMNLPLDLEAYECWKKVGMPEEHIVKCGKEDNFWGPTAETGPCGPCTEIFYDTGDGEKYVPGGEFDTKRRYIEIWNAGVFMQFNKNADGTFSRLNFTSVDTGAGLERLSMVLGGYSSVYDTDLLSPIKEAIESELEAYKCVCEKDVLIMTDHLRTATLILSEGVNPSNEGRGYVPRKLIRRCVMITVKNNINNFNFSKIVEFILDKYSNIFPKFKTNRNTVLKEFQKEQQQFEKILVQGFSKLKEINSRGSEISSEEAFELVTTYGLPFEIISRYAKENKMVLNKKEFEEKIKVHKEKSKNASTNAKDDELKNISDLPEGMPETEFVGYESLCTRATVNKIIKNGKCVLEACEGEEVCVISDKTSMYAQSGGQCADTGYISSENFKMKITDVRKTENKVFVHFGVVETGKISEGEQIYIETDGQRRRKIECNHTAVHLLQSALRKIYGNTVHQTGSKVEAEKLRFDFNCDEVISDEKIQEIESLVNMYIRENIVADIQIKKLSEAIESGATALFESKYGEYVRVVRYGDVSSELCGGTHTSKTGNIGMMIIVSLEGIGKGMKRITALTGECALNYVQEKIRDINLISRIYKVKPQDLLNKIEKSMISGAEKKSSNRIKIEESDIKRLSDVSGVNLGYVLLDETDKKINNEVIKIADKIDGIFMCVCGEERKQVILAVGQKQTENFKADDLLKNIMDDLHGKCGGNHKVASGSVSANLENIVESLKKCCDN